MATIKKSAWIKEAASIYVKECKWTKKQAMDYAKSLAEDDFAKTLKLKESSYFDEGYSPANAVYEDMTYWV